MQGDMGTVDSGKIQRTCHHQHQNPALEGLVGCTRWGCSRTQWSEGLGNNGGQPSDNQRPATPHMHAHCDPYARAWLILSTLDVVVVEGGGRSHAVRHYCVTLGGGNP